MNKHKWAKEIKAWADGAEIEQRHKNHTNNKWDNFDGEWGDGASGWDFRIKPQPKEPQYLYVYSNRYVTCTSIEKADNCNGVPYTGKIKLEVNDD